MIVRTEVLDLSDESLDIDYPVCVADTFLYRRIYMNIDFSRIEVYRRAFNDTDMWSEVIISGVAYYVPLSERRITALKANVIYQHSIN